MSSVICAPARPQDAGALKAFFDGLLPLRYPAEFYTSLFTPPPPFRYVVLLAVHEKRLVGGLIVMVAPFKFWRDTGALPFEMLEGGVSQEPHAAAACVMAMAVSESYRHIGIGSQLLEDGLVACLGDGPVEAVKVKAAFLMCQREVSGFYEKAFECMGELPGHYPPLTTAAPSVAAAAAAAKEGKRRGKEEEGGAGKEQGQDGQDGQQEQQGERVTALVMARPLWPEVELATYRSKVKGQLPDLSDKLTLPIKPMPPWLKSLLLYYVLPISLVVLLFGVCHLLVILGPLKGISGRMEQALAGGEQQQQSKSHQEF